MNEQKPKLKREVQVLECLSLSCLGPVLSCYLLLTIGGAACAVAEPSIAPAAELTLPRDFSRHR